MWFTSSYPKIPAQIGCLMTRVSDVRVSSSELQNSLHAFKWSARPASLTWSININTDTKCITLTVWIHLPPLRPDVVVFGNPDLLYAALSETGRDWCGMWDPASESCHGCSVVDSPRTEVCDCFGDSDEIRVQSQRFKNPVWRTGHRRRWDLWAVI